MVERERGDASVHRRQAVQGVRLGQPREEAFAEGALVRRIASQPTDSTYSTAATKPASSSCGSVPVSKRRPGGSFGAGRTLYGRQRVEQLAARERDAQVRPEELVRRADQHVDAERGDVDRPVRRVVHGVRPGERAGLMRELGDPRRVGERADRVRGERERDDLRPLAELRREVVEVERRVLVDPDEADDEAEVVRELEPGGDVRVVVEPGDEDLVACRNSRAAVRVSAKLSVVMFAPKTCCLRRSRGSARRSRAPVRSAPRCGCSSRTGRRRWRSTPGSTSTIASITESGTCVPPGPSKNARSRASAEKRARTASMSKAMVLTRRTLPQCVARAVRAAHTVRACACVRCPKKSVTPAATKVPFIVAGHGLKRRGVKDTRSLVSGLDVLPTLCDLAGIPAPTGARGMSVRGAVDRPFVVSELSEYGKKERQGRMLRTRRYKYVVFNGGARPEQLFDLELDPGNASIVSNTAVLSEHRRLLDQWIAETKDDFVRP